MRWSLFKFMAVFFTLTTTAFCQIQNLDFNGGGARAEGMGKAFLAVSDDISAVSWNPAGLFVHEKPTLGFSVGSFMPRGNYNYRGTELDQTESFSNITFLSFLAPVRIKGHQFVLSGSYSTAFEEYYNTAFDSVFTYTNAFGYDNNASYSETTDYHGSPYLINIGFGTRIYKSISFGASANIYTGKIIQNAHAHTVLENLVTEDSYNQEILFEEDFIVIDTTKISGINFTIGFKYNADKYDVGLIIKTPFDVSTTTGSSQYRITKYNGGVKTNWTDTIFVDNILEKVEIPLIVGLGGAYHLNQNILLSMDMEYRGYEGQKVKTRTEFSIRPGGEKDETYVESDPMWQDVFTVRVGGEYQWHTGLELLPLIPLRIGFAYLPLSGSEFNVDTVTVNDSLYQIITTSKTINYNISAGLGVHWSQIYLDLAYTYSMNDMSNFYYDNEQAMKNRYHHFNLTFTGYF